MKAEIIEGITGKELKIGNVKLSKGGIHLKNALIQSGKGYRLLNGIHGLVVQTLEAPGSTVRLCKMSEKNKKEAVRLAKEILGWSESF